MAADARIYGGVGGEAGERQLLESFESVGAAGLSACHGDFAFAYWDRLHQRLSLARDHFGVRPLQFTVRRGEYVAFASLPGALLRTGLASRQLDEAVIASFPVNGQPMPGRSYFKSVHCVDAAHVVEFDSRGSAKSRRYWRVGLEKPLPLDTDPAEAAAEVRRLLEQAVSRRIPAAGAVASHMSGGLDSTPIAVLAARAVRAEGRTCLAYSFQEDRSEAGLAIVDEQPYVQAAAESEPNLVLVPITSRSYFSLLSEGVDPDTMLPLSPDEPEEAVLRHAASAGAQILFSGWGGDQVVTSGGGGMESELFWAGRWLELKRELELRSRQTGRPPWREFLTRVVWRQLPAWTKTRIRRLRGQDSWLSWARFIAAGKRSMAVHEARPQFPDSRATRRAELEAWWIPYRLEMFAQQGARHGIAYVYPMLDLDLIAYAMRLPGTVYRRGGVPRRLIRDAIEGLVPESVRWREDKLAPYPVEALRAARERDAMVQAFRRLGASALVRQYLDVEAIIEFLRSGRDADLIRDRMASDASTGSQFTSEEDDHEFAMRLAYFLDAQGGSATLDS
jgi:asparagine synthase (glutamine-hydrolysing)